MPSDRRPLLAANWKMNKTNAEAEAFCRDFAARDLPAAVDVVICAPHTALRTVAEAVSGSAIRVAAQNMHEEQAGAFTGEVSAPMLLELGVAAVVLGHSERRALFGESDAALAKKVPAALAAGLLPILCVGETEEEREQGETERKLRHQVQADLAAVPAEQLAEVVIAYEPIWAIGTGRTATPNQAEEVHQSIRGPLARLFSAEAASRVRILYGGSVKPDNVDDLMAEADIDGALVGGASLDASSFTRICGFHRRK
jgi:triosephosphate isomerase